MSYLRALTLITTIAASSVALGACNDAPSTAPNGPNTPQPRVVTTVSITDPGVLTDGDVRPLQATVTDQFGVAMPSVAVQWSVTDRTIAAISETGVLTALAEGATQVTATAAGKTTSRPLVITRHPAARVDISQPLLEVMAGSTRQLYATVRGADGRALTGRTVSWQSADATVARVSAAGLVTAVAPGQTTITARHGDVATTARVIVNGFASSYEIASLDGRALPLLVEEWEDVDENGFKYQMIERLERGTVLLDGRYDVELVVGIYRRQIFQGNVIEQRIRQRLVRDRGQLEYNWLDGSARLESELIGNLKHELRPQGTSFQLNFRLGGTNTIWGLALRRTP